MACKDQREPDSPSRASADLAPTALVGGTRPKEWQFRDGSFGNEELLIIKNSDYAVTGTR